MINRSLSLVASAMIAVTPLAGRAEESQAHPQSPANLSLPAACADRDGWSDPAPPHRIFGNVWYVGTCGIAVVLIASPSGHIVIDGGPIDGGKLVANSIRKAGFRLRDVRWILSGHEHHDHAGGIAELQRLTGAKVAARAPGAAVLRTGTPDPTDPQAGDLTRFDPVPVSRLVTDGETIALGRLRVTAHATPGHSPGSTSWTWRTCDKRTCHAFGYADSISAISAEGYRFTDHPEYVVQFRKALATMSALECDLLITPHPAASNLFDRLAGKSPLTEAGACAAYAGKGRAGLDSRLSREADRKDP